MSTKNLNPLFSAHIPVRWADMDAYGHVNNAMYLRYMEEARIQFLVDKGIKIDGKGLGPVIINADSNYLKAVTYPDTLRVDCYLDQPGRSSFMSYYKLYSQAMDNTLVCDGSAKIVWIDTKTNLSVSFPENIRHLINSQTTT